MEDTDGEGVRVLKLKRLAEAKTRIRAAPTRSLSNPEPAAKRPIVSSEMPDPPPPQRVEGEPETTSSGSKDVLLDAILKPTEKIDKMSLKTDNMVSKQDLEEMQTKMETKISKNTKMEVASQMDPLKDKIWDIHTRLERVEQTGSSNQNVNGSVGTTDAQNVLRNQINALQAKIAELSIEKRPVAVIGLGRKCIVVDDAKIWINNKCKDYGFGPTVDIYGVRNLVLRV